MIIRTKTRKICAGEYEVTSPDALGRAVRIVKVWYPNDGEYWIADPDFDSNSSDPLLTKRDAVSTAAYMLENY